MMAFDENKYKKIFEERYGSGSYESGLSNARKIGQLKAQAEIAKSQYNERKKAAKNKSYNDALGAFGNTAANEETEKQLQDIIANPKKEGAYRNEEKIRNNPALQEAIKSRGWTQKEFIDAMYNAASGGQFKSERDFNSFNTQLKKDTKANNKKADETQKAKNGLSVKENYEFEQQQKKSQKEAIAKNDKKVSGLDKLKKNPYTQALNPFDDVSLKEAVTKIASKPQTKFEKESNRFADRTLDSATLGGFGALYKGATGKQPEFLEGREGAGNKALDFASTGAGYLIPGTAIAKGLRGTKAGENVAKGMSTAQKTLQYGKEGAITGGLLATAETPAKEYINPEQTALDHFKRIGLETAIGGVADPAIMGLGYGAKKGIQEFTDRFIPLRNAPALRQDSISPRMETIDKLKPTSKGYDFNLPGYQAVKNNVYNANKPIKEYTFNGQKYELNDLKDLFSQKKSSLNNVQTKFADYQKEYKQAVEDQYNYLKSSMGKGNDYGTTGEGLGNFREVTGSFNVSRNPKWYQDFAKQNNYRRPTNAELRQLAEQQVREGFEDELGTIPAWQPERVRQIDDEIGQYQAMLNDMPEQQEAIQPIINALEQEKNRVISETTNFHSNVNQTKTELDRIQQALSNPMVKDNRNPYLEPINEPNPDLLQRLAKIKKVPEYENISAGKEIKPIRLKDGEQPIDRTPIDIQNPKEIVKRQIDIDGQREKTKWSFDKAYTAVVSDLHPVNKATMDLGGKNLPIEKDPHKLAQLARGSAGKAETHLRGGFFNEKGEKIASSLEEIIKPVEKKMDDFLAYLTSKRTIDYDEKGLQAGIKPKDVEGMSDRQLADATIRQLEAESPNFKAQQEKLVNYSHNIMNELKESGYYTEETLKGIFKENPNYVPMNRVQEPKVRGFEPLTNPKNKFASLTNPLKQRTGSEKPIINPIESLVKNTYAINNIAERNKAGVALFDLIEQSPDNKWGRIVGKTQQDASIDNLTSVLDDVNVQMNDGRTDAIDRLFKGEGNKVYVYKDGFKVEMELQEDLYKAMLSLDSQQQNFFFNMMAVPARTLRAGAVLSPDFGPVNIFRDQLSAWVNSKYNFIPFVDMAKGMKSVLKKDSNYWLWKQSGGANSVLSTLDREYLQQDLRKMVKQSLTVRTKNALKNPKELPLKALNKALEPLRKVSEITEEATRVGEFKKGLKKGATPKEAAYYSRDLIDFSRAGNIGRQYNQVTAFFNAAVQSVDKLARTFKERPVEASVKALTGITIPSVALYYQNHDKEWYKEIPQRDKDLYWHFEVDDQIYKLPKPFEAGVLFGTSFERMLDYMKTDDPKAFEGFGKTVVDAFTPNWIPTAILPWIEAYGNKSMYFDSPIVPRREEGLLPEDQYGPYQSELSKAFGKLTKTSPRKAEHVFKGYTGGLGKYTLMGTDAIAKISGAEKPELPDRGMADMPILNRFVVKNLEGNNQSVNDFYKRLDKLKRESLSAKKNNPNRENTLQYKAINKLSGQISELQAQKRNIIDNTNMSGEEKASMIKAIDKHITEIAKRGNDL